MKEVLECHLGKTIGVNIEKVHHIDAVELLSVSETYFSVRASTDNHLHHIPYTNVIKIIEDDEGVEIRHLFTINESFNIVIKMSHVVMQTIA